MRLLLKLSTALALLAGTLAAQVTVPTLEQLLVAGNGAESRLSTGISASATSIVLTDGSSFPTLSADEAFVVLINGLEFVKVCGRATNTLTVCTGGRGFDGSSAQAHNRNSRVILTVAAAYHNELASELIEAMEAIEALEMGGGGGAVSSVNGQTGVVVLDAGDIGVTPVGGVAATDAQAAIAELDSEKAATSHAHAAADITSGELPDARVADTITLSNLTQITTRNYSDLQSIPSTFAPAAHVLDGATHTVSGLTTGHYLRANSATTFGFAQPSFSELSGSPTDEQIPDTITVSNYLPLTGGQLLSGSSTLLSVKAGASQSGVLQNWLSGADAVLASVGSDGELLTAQSLTLYSGTSFTGRFNHFNTSNRVYTLPNGTGSIPLTATTPAAADISGSLSAGYTINAGAVSADELDEAGVEAALEAVLDLQDLQGTLGTGQAASGFTLDTEWDTIGEIETATGVNILVSTEIDTIGELNGLVGDDDVAGLAAVQTFATGTKTVTAKFDFGGGTLEIPNSNTLPATCAVGELYMDTDATSGQRIYACQSTNTWALQGDGGAGGSGDAVTVNGVAVDTTADLDDTATVEWTLVDGGAGGPDQARASIVANSVGPTQIDETATYDFSAGGMTLPSGTAFGAGTTPFNLTGFTDDVAPSAPGTANQFTAYVDRSNGFWSWIINGGSAQTAVTTAGTQTLTNKTLTTPVIATISNTGTLTLPTSTDTLVGRATTDTLTNKTLTAPVIGSSAGAAPTASGVLQYDSTANALEYGDNGTNRTVANLDEAQTFTNKTLTTPVIASISNSGTITVPTGTDTLVARATTDTLTNKTLTSPTIANPVLSTNSYVTLTEMAAPASPSANDARLYAKDDGGTTKICMKDSAGTETCIGTGGGCAIESGFSNLGGRYGVSSVGPGNMVSSVASGSLSTNKDGGIAGHSGWNDGDLAWITMVLPPCYSGEGIHLSIVAGLNAGSTWTTDSSIDVDYRCLATNELSTAAGTSLTDTGTDITVDLTGYSNFDWVLYGQDISLSGCNAGELLQVQITTTLGTNTFPHLAGMQISNQ